MSVLTFQAADVRRVVDHSIHHRHAQQGRVTGYDRDSGEAKTEAVKAPAVVLVHDSGVYLISNAIPRDIPEGSNERRAFVAYAKGCDPIQDGEWWETSRDLVGGDDFSECLEWAEQIKAKLDGGAKTIRLSMTPRAVTLL